ncbi:MAG: 50S ribosomal protein L11 methyltransferase [Solirubrobacteraceae bacterium]
MREVVLRIPRIGVEDVLDRLLLIVPGGVRESRSGGHAELRMRGGDVPALSDIEAAVGRWPHTLSEREVPDDWRERRLADYEPEVIGGRLVVRHDWAPAWAPATPKSDSIEIVLAEGSAFGGGTHPTTRQCLAWLLELPAGGSFVDLGCGTGVLAILAARLGWAPVTALDVQPESVAAAIDNAARNGARVQAEAADLALQAPPPADGFAANVPAPLHELIAARFAEPLPRVGLISGFGPEDAGQVAEAYARRGLVVRRQKERHGWVVAVLERD